MKMIPQIVLLVLLQININFATKDDVYNKIRHGRHLEIEDETATGAPEPPSWANEAAMRSFEADSFDQRVMLNCRANGNPYPTMAWFHRGIPIDENHHSGVIRVRINYVFFTMSTSLLL